jgi:hypothetical protein
MFTYALVAIIACALGLVAGFTIGFTHAVNKFNKRVNKK